MLLEDSGDDYVCEFGFAEAADVGKWKDQSGGGNNPANKNEPTRVKSEGESVEGTALFNARETNKCGPPKKKIYALDTKSRRLRGSGRVTLDWWK